MKILISQTFYRPYLSGVTVYSQRLVDHFLKANHQVEVITSRYDVSLRPIETWKNLTIKRVKPLLAISKGFILPGWIVSSFVSVKRNDIIICHLPQVEGLITLFWTKLLRKNSISVYHCEVGLSGGLINQVINRLLNLIDRLCLNLSGVIVNSSSDYVNNSAILRKYKNRIQIITPPILDYTTVEREKINNDIFYAARHRVGFVGRFSADKGIEYLIQSAPIIKQKDPGNIKIFLVGSTHSVGENTYVKNINQLLHKHAQEVVCLGQLSDGQLSEFYQSIDVLVLPSVNSTEAYGMVQAEAMLCGCPVVASNIPGVREAVSRTGFGLLLDPRNPNSISQSILQIISDHSRFVKRAKVARSLFSIDKTFSLFDSLIVSS